MGGPGITALISDNATRSLKRARLKCFGFGIVDINTHENSDYQFLTPEVDSHKSQIDRNITDHGFYFLHNLLLTFGRCCIIDSLGMF